MDFGVECPEAPATLRYLELEAIHVVSAEDGSAQCRGLDESRFHFRDAD